MSADATPPPPPPPPPGAAAHGATFQTGIDSLLELVAARSRGEVSSSAVEEAVSRLLREGGEGEGGDARPAAAAAPPAAAAAAAAPPAAAAAAAASGELVVDEDEEDYDNLDAPAPVPGAAADAASAAEGSGRGKKRPRAAAAATCSNDDDDDDDDGAGIDRSKNWDDLDAIPLGRQGAKMMVTFGDGRNPVPAAVEAALMGARGLVQSAIRDARVLRRKRKAEFNKARVAATRHTARPKSIGKEVSETLHQSTVDPDMLFRAIGGYDRLSYDPKCGFDLSELEGLFPEEMRSYQRYKKMQNAYAQSKEDHGEGEGGGGAHGGGGDGPVGKEGEDGASSAPSAEEDFGGHLGRRLKQFDARTEQMKERWYLRFSEVRQGSFVERVTNAEGRMWRDARKKRRQAKASGAGARSRNVTWESLPAGVVKFLHWLGFDLTSAIPPPNEETANALAFLAHDFMGKIVEKAIFLRYLAKRDEARDGVVSNGGGAEDGDDFLLQLRKEQLSLEDVERALRDSTVMSEPLYGAHTEGSKPQLYFGPGFEERLEMEVDEIMIGKKGKAEPSEEEEHFRQQEESLFAEMKKPPTKLEGVLDVLGEEHITEKMKQQRVDSKKTQKVNDLRKKTVSDRTGGARRKRGRRGKSSKD